MATFLRSKDAVLWKLLKAAALAFLGSACTALAQTKDAPDYSLLRYQGPDRAQKLMTAVQPMSPPTR